MKKRNGYLLKVQFSYSAAGKEIHNSNEMIISENNEGLIPLTEALQGVALIGKIHKAKNGAFTAEYMIVDTASSPVSVQTMGFVSNFGKMSEITSEVLPQKAKVSLLATPTEYTQTER